MSELTKTTMKKNLLTSITMSDIEYESEGQGEEDEYEPGYDSNEEDYYVKAAKEGRAKRAIPAGLNVEPYTLDHPLITDSVHYLEETIRGHRVRLPKDSRLDNVATVLRLGGCKPNGYRGFHGWCAEMWNKDWQSEGFEKLWNICNNDAKTAWAVPEAFFRGWVKRGVSYRERRWIPKPVRSLGTLFYEMHHAIVLLNCRDAPELEKADRGEENWEIHTDPKLPTSCTFTSPCLGKVLVCDGYMYLYKHKMLLDRNMALMLKDVAGGRFQALLRTHMDCSRWDRDTLLRVYKLGDNLLTISGSKAYNAIKMVEAVSSDSAQQLLSADRPDFPHFTAYRDHLDRTEAKLESEVPGTKAFFAAIREAGNLESYLNIYGSYRLWGHPFLDYISGLRKLREKTTLENEIDEDYAEVLGSDLAFKVLSSRYSREKVWYVDKDHPDLDNHPGIKHHVMNGTWPNASEIKGYGPIWHKLPLTKCFHLPDVIDPSVIYADKSHSMDFSGVRHHIESGRQGPIPSVKVINSLLENEATDFRVFLQKVNDDGLDQEDLVIGLRCKERELKEAGRFFALMSRRMREYFVATEHLIKQDFVPLFNGITMADDQNQVFNKMWTATEGQSTVQSNGITITNSIDYTSWNNYQRGKANNPAFKVMGQFYGLPNLFTRTHEIFEKSLIYYKARPDLMSVENGEIINKLGSLAC